MDGTLMKMLHGNLNLLSEESFKTLLKYFETGSLTSLEQSSLLSEITELKDTWKVPPSPASKNLTLHQEIT